MGTDTIKKYEEKQFEELGTWPFTNLHILICKLATKLFLTKKVFATHRNFFATSSLQKKIKHEKILLWKDFCEVRI